MKDREEIMIRYGKNGQIEYEIPLKNGLRHGLTKFGYSNGKVSHEIPYINGKIDGLERGWCGNGQISYEIPHKNDIQFGAMIEFKY